jgi:hypothetical protein
MNIPLTITLLIALLSLLIWREQYASPPFSPSYTEGPFLSLKEAQHYASLLVVDYDAENIHYFSDEEGSFFFSYTLISSHD